MKDLLYRMMTMFFSFFPIRRKKVLFFSYYGSQYGGNPKYLSRYMAGNAKGFDLVWAFTVPGKYHIPGVRVVRYGSVRFFYELCTSGFIVTNYRMPLFFSKRRGQTYIQTWHSSLRLKTIEKDAEDKLEKSYIAMAKKDSMAIDCLLSGCRFSTEIFKSAFWYDGYILECGTPRNDLFFTDNAGLKKKIAGELSFSDSDRIVLYAPTFRKNYNLDCYDIDYRELVCALNRRFGGEWRVLVRLHPHLSEYSDRLLAGTGATDVTAYDDIQELLAVSDVLISDYSSLIFDFGMLCRPCFLYVPDLDKYVSNDRKLYFEVDSLPFVKARSNSELMNAIYDFDNDVYKNDLRDFNRLTGSFEDGNACRRVLEYIYRQCDLYK